jgi:hypothetical protein
MSAGSIWFSMSRRRHREAVRPDSPETLVTITGLTDARPAGG